MAEPISTTAAAGGALVKIFGVPVLTGSLAAALGFIFLWPRTPREAFARFACSIISSATAGPLLVIWMRSCSPGIFEAARAVAVMYGVEPTLGFLFIAAPILVVSGLPAWWIIGGAVRWLDNRRDKDLGAMVRDAITLRSTSEY